MKIKALILFAALAVVAVPSFGSDEAGMNSYQMLRPVEPIEEPGYGEPVYWYDSYDTGTYLDNPCTAVQDWVYVDYNVYLSQEAYQSGTSDRYLFDESTYMGGGYATTGSTQADVGYKMQPFTLRQYHKVNTYDDFHVVTVIDFDPASLQSYMSIETACGDGTPASAQ